MSSRYNPPSVSDAAYDATAWDGVTTVAPSKNAVRDKLAAIEIFYVVDATTYGDGVTNARAAIQTKLAEASAAGGGIVYLPEGTYLVDMAPVPGFAGYHAGIVLPSGVTLMGAGRRITTVKLAANEARDATVESASIICNADLDGAGDTDLGVMDLTVDGNAANQTKIHHGITMIRTRGAIFTRVTVKNVRGTGSSPPSETFHFETQLGMDTRYTDCTVVGDAGSTASGFSADNATGIHYKGCIAYGMTASMGFTHYQCRAMSYVGCHAYLNAVHGFNSEESSDVSYLACHAGGEVAPGSSPWPLAAGTTLGNGSSGFVVNGTRNASLVGCTSRKNATGLTVPEGTNGASGRVVGCAFLDNSQRGVSFSNAATVLRWFFGNDNIVSGNTTANYDLPTGFTNGPGNEVTTPVVPASATLFANPYPFVVTVYIVTPGTISLLRVNNADIDITTKSVRLLPGMTIGIWYSVAPTWLWVADG